MSLGNQVKTGEAVFDLITKVATKHTDVASAIKALEKIAAGKDGVLGTQDDTMDQAVLDLLKLLLRTGVAAKIVCLANKAAHRCGSCGFVQAIKRLFK